MEKQKFISDKISTLMKEGKYSRQQASLIAYQMFEKSQPKAQQGDEIDNSHLKPIYSIQQGVSSDSMGNGVYINYANPSEQGFSSTRDRDFVKNEHYKNMVIRSPAYQKYSRDKAGNIPFQGQNTMDEGYRPSQPSSNLKPIYSVQEGVTNDKLGNGKYIFYKNQSDPSFNYSNDRDFVTEQAFRQEVMNSPAYQKYSRDKGRIKESLKTNHTLAQASLQQGGAPPFEESLVGNPLYANYQGQLENSNYVLPGADLNKPDTNTYNNHQAQGSASNYINIGNEDLNNPMNDGNIPDYDMQQRMAKNKEINTHENNYDEDGNAREDNKKYYDTNRVNIVNPYGGMNLDYTMALTGKAFGEKEYTLGALGTGLSVLKGARNFLTGYSTGKENSRVAQEYRDKVNEDNRRYIPAQQGGKIKNSDILAQNAITDNPQGNINLEGQELVMRTSGQIQPVVGDRHIENGKIGKGVNAQLNEGDKVLSDYVKLKPTDIKDLKERYNISLKKGITFAQAQKKIDQKLGIKRLENEKADILEKVEKANKIKDVDTKQLSIGALTQKIAGVNEKIEALSDFRSANFEYLFEKQEMQPKKGNPGELFDKNGKEVTETNSNVAQQGGMIESLAKKHGISVERAHELMSYQQGGIQSGQEEMQEGQASNPQEEQGEISPEQIIQAFAQLSQQDPQQIVAQLQKMQPEEMQQALGQMMQALQQGQQNPQEEQAEGQMSNPQEEQMEVAQQGTTYMQQAGEVDYTKEPKDKSRKAQQDRLRAFQEDIQKLGFKGDVNLEAKDLGKEAGKMQEFLRDNYPELTQHYAADTKLTAKGIDTLKSTMPEAFSKMGISPNKKSTEYSADETNNLLRYAEESGRIDKDFLVNSNFVDYKWDWRRPFTKEKQFTNQAEYDAYIKDKGESYNQFYPLGEGVYEKPSLKLPQAEAVAKKEEGYTATPQDQKEVVSRDSVKSILPNFSNYIPLFSPIQSIAKENISIPRLEPIKATPEPMLAEQERQRQTDVERVEQTGMSPQQQEAILAQGLASSQLASNDAIGKVENYNAQNQFATDQYNLGAQTKEDIMNAQFRQDYQNKAFQTIANNEESMRNEYTTNFLQDQANSNKVIDMNRINMLSDQFAITPTGMEVLNNKPYEIAYSGESPKNHENMTASQVVAAKKRAIAKKAYEASLSK
jgi:hypothetical protein